VSLTQAGLVASLIRSRQFLNFVPIVSKCFAAKETLVSDGFLVLAIGMSLDPHAIFDMTRSGLNRIQQALSIYDADLKLAVSNRRFQEMFGLPDELIQPGSDFSATIRYLAEAGDYGEIDDVAQFVQERVDQALTFEPHYIERTRAGGMVISIEGSPVRQGGWVTVYTDITPIKRQEALLRGHSAQLSDQLLNRSEELAGINRKLAATNSALENAQRELTESEARTRVTAEMTPAHIARVGQDRRYSYRRPLAMSARIWRPLMRALPVYSSLKLMAAPNVFEARLLQILMMKGA